MRSSLRVSMLIVGAAALAACGGGGGSGDTEIVSSRSVPTATLPAQLPAPLIIGSGDFPATAGIGRPTHTVQPGDTPGAIAQAYSVGLSDLIAANGLGANPILRVGQKLVIPAPDTLTGPPAQRTPTPIPTPTPSGRSPAGAATPPAKKVYVVKAGDIGSAIADAHGITVAELARANGVTEKQLDRLLVGQELILP